MSDPAPPLASPAPTTPDATHPAGPQRRLSLFDAVCIIVGVIIGAGIFETAGGVAHAAGGPVATLLLWLAGGAVSLVGALCYAELATTYPRDGGEYVFLTRAYGPRVGFLFAWTGFWIVRPGSIGAMAYVFGHYVETMTTTVEHHGLGNPPVVSRLIGETTAAAVLVLTLTVINLFGVRAGRRTQNVLTAVKVLGIAVVIGMGAWSLAAGSVRGDFFSGGGSPDFRLALIFVLFTYGGWNEIAYLAAEVRDPTRNIARSLVIGTSLVTLVYVLFTAAVLPGLHHVHGLDERYGWMTSLEWAIGERRGLLWFLYVLVCLSSIGAVQGMLFSGARIYYAVGADHAAYRWLGRWDARGGGAPVRSLLAQGAVTLALVVLFGIGPGGFARMVIFTTPVFYLFFLLAAVSLFVLRYVDRDVPRAFRVPLYPLTPILFAASCAFMLWSSLTYAWENRRWEALWSIGLLLAGVVAGFWTTRAPDHSRGFEPFLGDGSRTRG